VDYLRQHPDAPVDLVFAVAHLCYEVGHRGHDPQWCNEAIRLCQPILAQPASPLEEAQARHLVALSQPTDRRAERIAELRTAYALVEHPAAADQETWRCLAQVVNSLAKELAKGAAEEQSEARRLFEYRLRLDEEQHLNDLRGVAVAVAGLGRLELYNEPTDIAGAEARFLRNLEISEAIGDLVGQVKMHSLLGACAWETGRTSEAEEHYRKSLDLAADQVDECFAAVGLMRCCLKQDRRDQFEVTAKRLLDLARRVPMPPECEAQLQSALEAIPPQSQSDTTTAVLRALRQSAGGSA
jgi:tetratricopeptide (TPR) repeat protein